MKEKLGVIAACLLFAVPFGGVGIFTGWLLFTTLYDGVRARDWVKVKATVVGESSYAYRVDGRDYTGDRMTLMRIGSNGAVNAVADDVRRAGRAGKPITVFVNPGDPAEALVDRDFDWEFVVGMIPFTFGFGGVGVGALWFMVNKVREPAAGARVQRGKAPAGPGLVGELAGIWLVAFMWNVIAFPISMLALPDIIRQGEWAGLFVLLFPLVGLLLIWGAVAATIRRFRRGRADFQVPGGRRVGEVLEGSLRIQRGTKAGDRFDVSVKCEAVSRGSSRRDSTYWTKVVEARAVDAGTGARVPFHFEIPANLPASGGDGGKRYRWKIEVRPAGKPNAMPDSTEVELGPALAGETRVAMEPDVAVPPRMAAVLQRFGRDASELSPDERAQLAKLTPGQQEAIGNVVKLAPQLKKILIGIVVLVVVVQLAGGIAALFGVFSN